MFARFLKKSVLSFFGKKGGTSTMLSLKNCANDIVRPRCPRYSVSDRSESIAMRKKCQISQMTPYTLNVRNFTCVFTIPLWIWHFLGFPWEIVFSISKDYEFNWITLKNIWKNAMLFKLSRCKVFIHWKLKLFHFPMDSVVVIFLCRNG